MQSAPKHLELFSGRQELTLGCALFNISGTSTPVILPRSSDPEFRQAPPGYVCVSVVSHHSLASQGIT